MPHFEIWSQDNLAKFARDAYLKMQEQQDRIAQLQNELKDAIAAYKTTGPLLVYEPRMPREWVGLTDEEINEVLGSDIHAEQSGELRFIRAIEAKIKEKNG